MASNREDTFSFLEDRNRRGTNVSDTSPLAPIYVEGTPSREVMFRLPPLQNMQPSITTEHSLGGGDVSVSRNFEQPQLPISRVERPNYPGPDRESSYERPSFGYTSNTGTFGLGVRNGIVSQANLNTAPLVSTVIRNSNTYEASRNLSSDFDRRGSLGSYGPSRVFGDQGSFMGAQNTKGMKPGTYDGTGSWSDFLIQFNLIADYYHWNNYDKALQLATHLRGTAQGVLGDLSQTQRTDFESLTSALAARFEPVQQSELYRAKIKSRLRRKGEPIVELAQDVRKLIRLAYPSANADVREQLSKDCFIDALNDHDLEWAVLQGKPCSVEDAMKLALEYEAFQKGRRGRYGDVRPFSTEGQDLMPEINGGLLQSPGAGGNQNRGSNANGRRKKCTFCQRTGHVENECYQKKNLQNADIRACYFCNSTDHLIRDCEARRRHLQGYANRQGPWGMNGISFNQGNGNQTAQGGNQPGNGF